MEREMPHEVPSLHGLVPRIYESPGRNLQAFLSKRRSSVEEATAAKAAAWAAVEAKKAAEAGEADQSRRNSVEELNKELVGVQTRLLNTARKSPERRRLKDESERLQRVIDGEVAQIRRPDVSCDTEVE